MGYSKINNKNTEGTFKFGRTLMGIVKTEGKLKIYCCTSVSLWFMFFIKCKQEIPSLGHLPKL